MTLFYISILFMVVMVVVTLVPLSLAIASERRHHLVTPAEIAGAASSVRPTGEAESDLLARAEAAALAALEEAERPVPVGEEPMAA